MKIGKLILGAALLATFTANAQGEEDRNDCNRYKKVANVAYGAKNYKKAATAYIMAERECGGLENAFYSPMIYSLTRVIKETEGDAEVQAQYIDTLLMTYENAQRQHGINVDYKKNEGSYYLKSTRADKLEKADSAFSYIIYKHTDKATDYTVQQYYANIYTLWSQAEGEAKSEYTKRFIGEYFKLNNIVSAQGLSPKTLEVLTAYLDYVARDCESLLPEINGFMANLPQDKDLKKSNVNNFIKLLETKSCTDSKEYEMLIDTLISIDPTSVDAKLQKAKLLDIKGKTSSAVTAYKEVIELTDDADVISDAELAIAAAYYRARSYKAAHNAGLAVSGKNSVEGAKIAANSVMASINDCGNSTFERKANNYYAVEIANKYGFSASRYQAACPTTEEMFNASRKAGETITLECWGKTVTIQSF